MTHLPWMHESRTGRTGTSESESLQTDVMRFLAILGFCLVAVFALVQGLDVETPVRQRSAEAESALAALEVRVAELRREQSELERAVVRARRLDEAAAARVGALQRRVRDLAQESQRMAQVRDEIVAEVAHNEARLQARSAELKALEKRRGTPQTPVRESLQAPARIAEQPRREKTRQRPSVSVAQDTAAAAADSEAQIVQSAADIGFDLRFASAAALRTLVGRGRVSFYARVRGQRYRAGIGGAEVRFTPASLSGSFYEMTAHTVPEEFVDALIRQVPGATRHATDWGVTLPVDVRTSVSRLSQGSHGGVILISADERVVLQAGT